MSPKKPAARSAATKKKSVRRSTRQRQPIEHVRLFIASDIVTAALTGRREGYAEAIAQAWCQVRDNKTGLIWCAETLDGTHTWAKAKDAAAGTRAASRGRQRYRSTLTSYAGHFANADAAGLIAQLENIGARHG